MATQAPIIESGWLHGVLEWFAATSELGIITAVTLDVPLEPPLQLGADQRHFSFKEQKQESNFSWPKISFNS